MKFDRYNLISRMFPAMICVIPIMTFIWFFLTPEIIVFFKSIYSIKWISNLSIALICIFTLAQVNRIISKEIFEKKYFKNELNMPTTNFLLYFNAQYSDIYKKKIHNKIFKDFGIKLLKASEELDNITLARKKITEAVSHIRVEVGNGMLLAQHKIEYGFFRNLVGGSLIAFVFSIINIILFIYIKPSNLALQISIITLFLFFIPVLFSKKIILATGNLYAKILIQEYMSKK